MKGRKEGRKERKRKFHHIIRYLKYNTRMNSKYHLETIQDLYLVQARNRQTKWERPKKKD